MPRLPRLSGLEAIKIIEEFGFRKVRQRGSHVVMRRGSLGCVIPLHDELAFGTLKNVLRQAAVSENEFIEKYQA